MPKQKKPPVPSKGCIFCGGRPLTKEHVFPSWIRDKYPSTAFHRNLRGHQRRGEAPTQKARPGRHVTVNFRVVCSECNERWMKDIQDALRDPLSALMDGRACVIDTQAQELLAAWAAMKTMVSEAAQGAVSAISHDDRKYLWVHHRAPLTWRIGISAFQGYFGTSGILTYRALATDESVNEVGAPEVDPVETLNTQSTLIFCGRLLIAAVSSAVLDIEFNAPVRQIWPSIVDRIIMPGVLPPLTIEEAMRLGQSLGNLPGATYA
jgi:hypothetical protein